MSLWDDLGYHHAAHADRPILSLFEGADRARHFSIRADGLLFDYSKTGIDAHARDMLLVRRSRSTETTAGRSP